MASNHGTVAHLLPQTYKRMVSAWLEEDCPSFDYGGFVVGEAIAPRHGSWRPLLRRSLWTIKLHVRLLLTLMFSPLKGAFALRMNANSTIPV